MNVRGLEIAAKDLSDDLGKKVDSFGFLESLRSYNDDRSAGNFSALHTQCVTNKLTHTDPEMEAAAAKAASHIFDDLGVIILPELGSDTCEEELVHVGDC